MKDLNHKMSYQYSVLGIPTLAGSTTVSRFVSLLLFFSQLAGCETFVHDEIRIFYDNIINY